MQKICGFLHRGRTMGHDKAADHGPLGGYAGDCAGKLQPFGWPDRRAADAAKRHRQYLCNRIDFRIACNHLLDRKLTTEVGVVEHIRAVGAQRRDGAATAYGRNEGFVRHNCPPSSSCTRLELLTHHVACAHRRVARRIARAGTTRNAGNLGVVVRMQEVADRHAPAADAPLGWWIDHAVQVRHPAVIGPALHHVTDIDNELVALGRDVGPRAVFKLHL